MLISVVFHLASFNHVLSTFCKFEFLLLCFVLSIFPLISTFLWRSSFVCLSNGFEITFFLLLIAVFYSKENDNNSQTKRKLLFTIWRVSSTPLYAFIVWLHDRWLYLHSSCPTPTFPCCFSIASGITLVRQHRLCRANRCCVPPEDSFAASLSCCVLAT
jgi:hypothetical protein